MQVAVVTWVLVLCVVLGDLVKDKVIYEFDRPPSPRAAEHLGSALHANPNATVVLVEMESTKMSPEQIE